MSTPTEVYPLPDAIPTVKVTGMYRGPDGRGLIGTVTFTGPPLLTFAESDLFIGGSVAVKLDPFGQFEVTLPATDAPDMNPTGWAYTVKENLTNVTGSRSFSMVLPADTPGGTIDLADVAPADPKEYTYTPVAGESAYEIAVANGFVGTEAEWLASLVGPKGEDGVDGSITSVNGDTGPAVEITADDLGVIPWSERGAPNGVAGLDENGKLYAWYMPEGTGGGSDSGTLNVRSYGATGDGTTDDATSIQTALNAARDNGGGWVVVPPGTYLCATLPLRIYRNTRLTLMPGAVFKRGGTGTFLLNGDADQEFGGYTGHGNIVVEGGVWDMDAIGFPNNAMCISIGHAEKVTIRDLEIRDLAGYHGIELNSTKQGLVDNCAFRGYVDTGGRDFSEAVQIDLAGRPSLFGGFGPYDGTPCEDITMRDCYVGASGTAGTVAWPSGIGSHSATWGKWHRRIRVVNNTFEGGAQYTVKPYIWEESVVSGNTMKDCGAGIWLRTLDSSKTLDRTDVNGTDQNSSQNSTGFVISDNVIRGNGSFNDAIYVQGEASGKWYDVTITGNTIQGVAGSENGLRLENLERFTVANNALDGIGGTALSTATCSNGVLSGNRVQNCGGSFFTSDSGSRLSVIGNNCSDCGAHGFWAWSNTDLKVSDNFLRGAGRADATAQAFRFSSSGSARITLTNNTYRTWGSGTEATTVLSASSSVSYLRRFGNDWLNQSLTVSDTSTNANLSPLDSGA